LELDFFFMDEVELLPSPVNPRWTSNLVGTAQAVSTLLLEFFNLIRIMLSVGWIESVRISGTRE
jgi:hypothetical protein